MASTTPRLGLSYMVVGQAQKELTHSQSMARLDAIVQAVVQTVATLSAPPGSPAEGQAWIVGSSPTGAWAGKANNLALYIEAAWLFYAPFEGMRVEDLNTDVTWRYNGSAWVQQVINGSATWDPPNLTNGTGTTTTVTATGAALGDFAAASFSLSTQGILMSASVTAADTVTVSLYNATGGAIDLGSGTLRVRVEKL